MYPPGPRSRQATAIHRAIEPPTVGVFEPRTDPGPDLGPGLGCWITVVLVLAGALLLGVDSPGDAPVAPSPDCEVREERRPGP